MPVLEEKDPVNRLREFSDLVCELLKGLAPLMFKRHGERANILMCFWAEHHERMTHWVRLDSEGAFCTQDLVEIRTSVAEDILALAEHHAAISIDLPRSLLAWEYSRALHACIGLMEIIEGTLAKIHAP